MQIITDQSAVQEIKNSIVEGKNMLSTGKDCLGNELTRERAVMIHRATVNSMKKIGQSPIQHVLDRIQSTGYTITDVTPPGYGPEV